MNELPHVSIYSDGACDPNPGPGGWAVLLRSGQSERILTGSAPDTTNNRMELTAAIQGLRALKQPCRVDFYTDSEYVRRGITEWMPGWRARGWRRKEGPLANADLWQALDAEIGRHAIQWRWVRAHTGHRGHAGHAENDRVDRLARQAIWNVREEDQQDNT
jgi:ribonuclease HI